jgi:hypothetical protein
MDGLWTDFPDLCSSSIASILLFSNPILIIMQIA